MTGVHAVDPAPPRHLPALDGLRGVAALMVIWFHYWQALPDAVHVPALVRRTAVFGQTGVDLFFVLSGFLITRNLFAAKGHDGFFRNFYGRRALRIFPLYFGSLAALYVLAPALGLMPAVPAREQAWYWLYGQNIAQTFDIPARGPGHFWSLGVEEHFYLVWPFLVYALSRAALGRAAAGIIAVAIVSRAVLHAFGIGVFYFTLCRMDALAVGALLAVVEPYCWTTRARRALLAAGVGIVLALVALWSRVGASGAAWLQIVKFTPVAAVYGAAIGWASFGRVPAWLTRSLGRGPLAVTGTISYGLYVYHGFILYSFRVPWMAAHPLGAFFLLFGGTYAVASVSYVLYERPFLRFKRHFHATPQTELFASRVEVTA